MRGAPDFAERKARARARIIFSLDKIGSPAPRTAAPGGVLDPAQSGMRACFCLKTEGDHDDFAL